MDWMMRFANELMVVEEEPEPVARRAPGKMARTAKLQRRAAAGSGPEAAPTGAPGPAPGSAIKPLDPFWFATGGDAASVATEGVAGSGGALPYLETIQRAFGHHDLSGVRAHQDGAAAAAAKQLGAVGYAFGGDIAFASAPDLHTAAHEAAHVIQQRHGVQLKGDVGEVGDRYEQHADAVADRVVRGESAVALLDELAPATERGGAAASGVAASGGAASDGVATASGVAASGVATASGVAVSGGAVVQRRVTTAVAEANLLTDDEDGAANLEGLRQATRRTFSLLSQPDRATVTQQAETQHGKPPLTLLRGDRAELMQLTALIRAVSPDLAYPGAARTFAYPQSQPEHQRFGALVQWAVQTMTAIGAGSADAAITSVFGGPRTGDVRARFAHVGANLGNLARGGQIYSDLTGAREAMDAGALTSFGRYIQMNRSFLAGLDDGSVDAIGLMHEALHFYYQDITDHGGYADQVEAFKTRPADVKFTNAAHYEEVIRRFTNKGPVGGDFVPEDDDNAPERTPLQRAVGAAAGVLQNAWERGLNVHGFLVACHDHPAANQRRALVYFSSLLKLTLHDRAARVDVHTALTVNDIDLVATESVTKMLSTMKQQLRPDLLAVEEQVGGVDAMRDLLLRKVVRGGGPITGSVVRDLQVITTLAATPRDVSTVDLDPVGY